MCEDSFVLAKYRIVSYTVIFVEICVPLNSKIPQLYMQNTCMHGKEKYKNKPKHDKWVHNIDNDIDNNVGTVLLY